MKTRVLCLLLAFALITLPACSATPGAQVTLFNFYLGGSAVQAVPNPPQSMIVTIGSQYVGQEETQIVVTVVNPEGANLTWSLWSGLVNTAITGQSDLGFIGEQTGTNTWTAHTVAKRIIITIMGTVDLSKLQQGTTMILADLRYSVNTGVPTPLFTFSITPESTTPTEGPKVDAEATIQELETEVTGSNLPSYRTTYYESQLYKAKLYFENKDYDNALDTAKTALEALRAEQADYNNPINTVLRFISNNAVTITALAVVAVPAIYFSKLWRRGPVAMP